MTRRTLIPTTLLVAVIAAVGVVTPDRAAAAEPHIADMQVISSDVTARFVSLGLNKAVVIELPTDIQDVLVANPKIVNAVVRTKRRVYIIGINVGQTNIHIFDANSRQIGALAIEVSSDQQLNPPLLAKSSIGGNLITVFRGTGSVTQNCTRTACTEPPKTLTPSAVNSTATTTEKNGKGDITGTRTTSGTTSAN
jgi:pilus assembly protein CpaC